MQNPFRPVYKELDVQTSLKIGVLKEKAFELLQCYGLDETIEYPAPPNREISLAITKLEESVMWAVKGLTK